MHNLTRSRFFVSLITAICMAAATGCGTQPAHPNQLSQLDGASYDTMTLAHGALLSLRAQVSTSYMKYSPLFNESAHSYALAYDAYALFRTNPANEKDLNIAISNLTVSIVAFENAAQADLPVSPSVIAGTRKEAETFRQRAAGQNFTVSDLLTELEIAAAVARAVTADSVYARLASMIIQATDQALAAEAASAGQAIDLSKIQPVATI